MTIYEYRHKKAEFLEKSPALSMQNTALLDVDCILSHFLKKDRSWLFAHSDEDLEKVAESVLLGEPTMSRENLISDIDSAIEKRYTGYPVAYITNKKEFYGIDFYVNKNVLIPKPDTEILVEKAIELIKAHKLKTIADICTGSGCVGISVAKNILIQGDKTNSATKDASPHFFLTDVSHLCLEVAQKNANEILGEKIANENFSFFLGEILWPIIENENENIRNTKFDMILSNPPYIPRIMVNQLLRDGRSEPILALDGDASYTNPMDENYGDGLSIIRPLTTQAFGCLKSGGFFLCETGEYNSQKTVELFEDAGFSSVQVLNDLEGSPRVVMGVKK